MLRIAGIVIPAKKHIVIGLTSLFGVGRTTSKDICKRAGVPTTKKVSELTSEEEERIRSIATQLEIEGDLRRKITMSIKRLKDLKCFRGLRHVRGLPLRGQRTHTNAKTARKRKAYGGQQRRDDES